GYDGLIEGGDKIVPTSWFDVSDMMHLGGTVIGSARSPEFRTEEGRLKATINLLKNKIGYLIVIGGDGSLTGANMLITEFKKNLQKIKTEKLLDISENEFDDFQLRINGLIGSIDNDFVLSRITIGVDTALHQICASIDSIKDTARSHKRAFLIEVMGRRCGYLAVTAALCVSANFVLYPENPMKDWKNLMKKSIEKDRRLGNRISIVIIAEGAIDIDGNPISSKEVCSVLKNDLKLDTRITVLGHVQRGGNASAYDKIMSTRIGADSVLSILSEDYTEPKVISLAGSTTVAIEMMKGVNETAKISKLFAEKKFQEIAEKRGNSFQNSIELLYNLTHASDKYSELSGKKVGIIHLGEPSPGMNPVTECVTRFLSNNNAEVFFIECGINGLIHKKNDYKFIKHFKNRKDLNLMNYPGSKLGTTLKFRTNEINDEKCGKMSENLAEVGINALVIVGSAEAFEICEKLDKLKAQYTGLNIPIIMIPCSIYNDIPHTCFTIGSDSALNQISDLILSLKSASLGYNPSLEFIEVDGNGCNYLPIMSGLACGSSRCYILGEKLTVDQIRVDAANIVKSFRDKHVGTIVCAKGLSLHDSMDIDSIIKIYEKEALGTVECVKTEMKNFQRGCCPTPFDRKLAIKFGVAAAKGICSSFIDHKDGQKAPTYMVGIADQGNCFLFDFSMDTSNQSDLRSTKWWGFLNCLVSVLGESYNDKSYDGELYETNQTTK
ncbi:MAG: hypothetical protein MHPSP_000206, partial [Paramarteilia canceri]